MSEPERERGIERGLGEGEGEGVGEERVRCQQWREQRFFLDLSRLCKGNRIHVAGFCSMSLGCFIPGCDHGFLY